MSGPIVFLGTYRVPVGKVKDFKRANTVRIELYGKPSDRLLEQLQGVTVSSPVIVKTHHQWFSR